MHASSEPTPIGIAHEDRITTTEASAIIGVDISRIQQLCRAFLATGEGLNCERIGEGRHATYYVSRHAALRYRDASAERKRGFPKGATREGKRGRKKDESAH